jgi:hypothetical protein
LVLYFVLKYLELNPRWFRLLVTNTVRPENLRLSASLDHSQDDVELLSQVLRTLEEGRSISAATNRLYEVCKVFLRFATAFIWSRQNCFGSYNQEDDSFTFLIMGIGSATHYYNAVLF